MMAAGELDSGMTVKRERSVQICANPCRSKRDPGYGGATRPETCSCIFSLPLVTTLMIAGLQITGAHDQVVDILMADANIRGRQKIR